SMARPSFAAMATPLYVFCPSTTARYPTSASASCGKRSSSTLVSCMQMTSGAERASHAVSWSRRERIELTFQEAIRIGYLTLPSPWLEELPPVLSASAPGPPVLGSAADGGDEAGAGASRTTDSSTQTSRMDSGHEMRTCMW